MAITFHLVSPSIAGSRGAAPVRQPKEVLLVPVDGSLGATRAVAHAMEVATKGHDAHIHVLNVQRKSWSEMSAGT